MWSCAVTACSPVNSRRHRHEVFPHQRCRRAQRAEADPGRRRREPLLGTPPQQLKHKGETQRLPARLGEGAGEERPSLTLSVLRLARKLLEQAARIERQRDEDWLRRIPGLELDFAQPVERGDGPCHSWGLLTQAKRDRLGPEPEYTRKQAIIGVSH